MQITKVRLTRILRGLRQVDLAEKVDISQAYLSVIEAGRAMPPEVLAERIATALEVEAKWLFGEPA